MEASERTLHDLLVRFDHESFRPGQERVIRAILDGREALAVLPTGSGKSLVYQLAAQLLPGATVVVSPLIALMKDQVESLDSLGFQASLINSSLSASEQSAELERIERGESRLLFVTPERFDNDAFAEWISGIEVSLFVVDEAHCISEWGYDFRPAYLGLGAIADTLGNPAVLALTTTASPWVREEIGDRLHLRDPLVVVADVDRPNLFFDVIRVETEGEDKLELRRLLCGESRKYSESITDRLNDVMRGTGIIYTRTTRGAEETAEWLREWNISSDFYHGQRDQTERDRAQEAFMSGNVRVICATNAFGLGVDKPDVRFVIHRDVPANVEEYFQEAGRAGRDGNFARCALIYRPADLSKAAFLAATSHITPEKIEAVRSSLVNRGPASIDDLSADVDMGKQSLAETVAALRREELVVERSGQLRLTIDSFDPNQVSTRADDRREAYERSRVEMMRGYAELDSCRRRYILNYFGEEYAPSHCGMCDNDQLAEESNWIPVWPEADRRSLDFKVGDHVTHDEWGPGTVQRTEEDSITVLFDEVGYKQLANAILAERNLLSPMKDD